MHVLGVCGRLGSLMLVFDSSLFMRDVTIAARLLSVTFTSFRDCSWFWLANNDSVWTPKLCLVVLHSGEAG